MAKTNPRIEARIRRQQRVRKKVKGTGDQPRLCVFRSARHIYAQLIDDSTGQTLLTTSTLSLSLRDKVKGLNKSDAAKLVGKAMAEEAKAKGIVRIVFDRNGFLYHGRVAALSTSAREAGLEF
ncbi:MAG: 50S ribosomal protein L18 [Deltaproteobacteria bacterium]|nr:50S ribosomal protein L18 [Deltaproteobacteria bacterium]